MSNDVLTQTIVTGSDPRNLPEFIAIREEINKASHPSQPEMNWRLVESLALTIFKANGVDLHTATYYTLARTRTQGLAGFCEGAELLAAMITREWDKFWPQGGAARTEMLDWLNTRTGNILRQQTSFAENDLPLLYSKYRKRLRPLVDELCKDRAVTPHPRLLVGFSPGEQGVRCIYCGSARLKTYCVTKYSQENPKIDCLACGKHFRLYAWTKPEPVAPNE